LAEPTPRSIVGRVRLVIAAFVALTVGGCDPDLSREAGGLEITLTRIPAEADAVRIEITGTDVDPYAIDLVVIAADMQHVVDSVPATNVRVSVSATADGVVRAQAQREVNVVANLLNRVTIDLDTSGTGVVSDPLVFATQGTFVPGVATFELQLPIASATWNDFLARARIELGRDPTAFELRSAQMMIPEVAVGAEKFDEVWEELVSLLIVGSGGTPAVEVGRVADVSDENTSVFVPTAGAVGLEDLTADLLAGIAVARLSGEGAIGEEESTLIEVELTLVWGAR
jgi:hypothetical protein